MKKERIINEELEKKLNLTNLEFQSFSKENLRLRSEIDLLNSNMETKNKLIDEFKFEIEDVQSEKQIILKKSQNVFRNSFFINKLL